VFGKIVGHQMMANKLNLSTDHGNICVIGRGVHEGFEFSLVAELDLDHPTITIGIIIDLASQGNGVQATVVPSACSSDSRSNSHATSLGGWNRPHFTNNRMQRSGAHHLDLIPLS